MPRAIFGHARSQERLSLTKGLQATSKPRLLRKGNKLSHGCSKRQGRPLNIIHGDARFAKFDRVRDNSAARIDILCRWR
jgi:hypothetical protein